MDRIALCVISLSFFSYTMNYLCIRFKYYMNSIYCQISRVMCQVHVCMSGAASLIPFQPIFKETFLIQNIFLFQIRGIINRRIPKILIFVGRCSNP